jgi:hypothetical protein
MVTSCSWNASIIRVIAVDASLLAKSYEEAEVFGTDTERVLFAGHSGQLGPRPRAARAQTSMSCRLLRQRTGRRLRRIFPALHGHPRLELPPDLRARRRHAPRRTAG